MSRFLAQASKSFLARGTINGPKVRFKIFSGSVSNVNLGKKCISIGENFYPSDSSHCSLRTLIYSVQGH